MQKKSNFETFQFIIHSKVDEYIKLGWVIIDNLQSCHHGYYSVLMKAPKTWEKDLILKE